MDVATAMLADDETARLLGIELIDAADGSAEVRLLVRPDLVNGLGV